MFRVFRPSWQLGAPIVDPRPAPWHRPDPLPLPLVTPRTVIDVLLDDDAPGLLEALEASREGLLAWTPAARGVPRDEAGVLDVIRELARRRGHAHPEGYDLAIFDRSAARRVLGGTGFFSLDETHRQAEVGYWLRDDEQGRGLCTEAVGHLISSGFDRWGFRRLLVGTDASNEASVRVAERLGLRKESHEIRSRWIPGRGWRDHAGFAVLADEWDHDRHRGPAA